MKEQKSGDVLLVYIRQHCIPIKCPVTTVSVGDGALAVMTAAQGNLGMQGFSHKMFLLLTTLNLNIYFKAKLP